MTEKINLTNTGPHANTEVLLRGNTNDPKRALLLFHGRGSNAGNMLKLSDNVSIGEDMLICAPEASGHEWYPHRFIVPREENEPHLSSALGVVAALIALCDETYNIKQSNLILAGFSQGACVVADYIARNPQTYAGTCIFSGGLIGSDEEIQGYERKGNLEETPLYIGCDEREPHIPRKRVEATADVLQKLNANVTSRLYSGLGHAIHSDGIGFLQQLVS